MSAEVHLTLASYAHRSLPLAWMDTLEGYPGPEMIHPMRSGQQRRRAYMRVAEVVRAARQLRFFESLDVDEEHNDLSKDKNRLDQRLQ